jgi:hypothetical protein
MPDVLTAALLCCAALLAGFVDSVVGGGGLIQLPALFIAFPNEQPILLLGTNRTSSIFGTTLAASRYAREASIPWRSMLPAAVVAMACSLLGANVAARVDPALFKPIVLVILIAVAIYTLVKKDLGKVHAPSRTPRAQLLLSIATSALLGFYDGFLGPGTGSFLIFAFVGLLGFSFLAASASAKIINVATNASSFAWFLATGQILLPLGLLMAACNMAGAALGTRAALRFGSSFVRRLFLLIVSAVIARFAYDVYLGR